MPTFQGQSEFGQIKFLVYDIRVYGNLFKNNSFVIYSTNMELYFGNSVIQNSNYLLINKADLEIKPSLNNSAESLLAAIILRRLAIQKKIENSNISIELWRTFYLTQPTTLQIKNFLIHLYVLSIYDFTGQTTNSSNLIKADNF